jgi:hypothetical protein
LEAELVQSCHHRRDAVRSARVMHPIDYFGVPSLTRTRPRGGHSSVTDVEGTGHDQSQRPPDPGRL